MELLPGSTLAQFLKREGATNERRALPVIRQIVAALAAAYASGVVHRDLKPSNIIIGSGGIQIADTVAANINIAESKWHHVAAVVKRLPSQASAIYVGGALTAAKGKKVGVANLDHDEPAWIGRHRRNELINRDNIYYRGDLDELSIYRRALTPAEVKSVFAAGSKGKCKAAAQRP